MVEAIGVFQDWQFAICNPLLIHAGAIVLTFCRGRELH